MLDISDIILITIMATNQVYLTTLRDLYKNLCVGPSTKADPV